MTLEYIIGSKGSPCRQGDTIPFNEGHNLEFKNYLPNNIPKVINKTIIHKLINAFLNTSGGAVVFGIKDDSIINGFMLNKKEIDEILLCISNICYCFKSTYNFMNKVKVYAEPIVQKNGNNKNMTYEINEYKKYLYLIIVQVEKSDEEIYFNGDMYFRHGSSTRCQSRIVEGRIKLAESIIKNIQEELCFYRQKSQYYENECQRLLDENSYLKDVLDTEYLEIAPGLKKRKRFHG